VKFPNPLGFKNFAGFLKKLDKLTDLSLTVEKEEIDVESDYFYIPDIDESDEEFVDDDDMDVLEEKQSNLVEILSELFSLPNLTKLEFEFDHENQLERMANLKVQNPGVEVLTLRGIPVNRENKYSQFVKIFPSVYKAVLAFDFPRDIEATLEPDLTPTNSWASLEELKLNRITDNMLRQVRNLRGLKVGGCRVESDSSWYYFAQNNREFELLVVNSQNFKCLEVIADNLPNLRVLFLKTIWPGR
jgi:hypothetical protein